MLMASTLATATMSEFEAARSLPILDLLRLLNEKPGLEHTRPREGLSPPAVSTASLESEASPSTNVVTWDVV